jgi:hypothetical protein
MADSKLANPAALGLGGFAMTTFLLNFVNAEIVDADCIGVVLPVELFYGGPWLNSAPECGRSSAGTLLALPVLHPMEPSGLPWQP